MRYRTYLALALLVLTSGCGLFSRAEKVTLPSSPYAPLEGALDEEYFHTPLGDVAGRYPKGWLRVNVGSMSLENVLAVYTDPNRSRALVLAEIPGTAEFRRSVERDGLVALADQSFSRKLAKQPGKLVVTHPTDIYTVNGKLVATYEYAEAGADTARRKLNRVAVFTTGAKFYELGLVELLAPSESPAGTGPLRSAMETHTENFRLLESVIRTLEGVAQVRGMTDTTASTF